MKTGIIGGTFDPIHNAHILIAKKAYEEFGLNKVLFMPSPNPPHKDENEITPLEHRINMLKLAIEDYEHFEYSDFELNMSGNMCDKTFSADTLTEYKREHPDEALFFILGSDSLYSIDSWYRPDIIFEKATILAAKRDDDTRNTLDAKIIELKRNFNCDIYEIIVPVSDISSTKIRKDAYHLDLYQHMPKKAAKYLLENHLYKNDSGSKRMTNAEIINDLKERLDPYRLEHTIGVAKTAKALAERYGENPNKAYLAGLLHDCAKYISDDEQLKICMENHIEISAAEETNLFLLHAKVGAFFTKERYHIIDEDIINAVRYHTTGRENMSLLEKIIFTADYIEPSRTKQPNLAFLRELSMQNIDETVYYILKDTLAYLNSSGRVNIDDNTMRSYLFYKNLISGKPQ